MIEPAEAEAFLSLHRLAVVGATDNANRSVRMNGSLARG
jgi:hypothetical protein